jgi:hypothetical protein
MPQFRPQTKCERAADGSFAAYAAARFDARSHLIPPVRCVLRCGLETAPTDRVASICGSAEKTVSTRGRDFPKSSLRVAQG